MDEQQELDESAWGMERMVQGSEPVLQSLPSATHLHTSVPVALHHIRTHTNMCHTAPHKCGAVWHICMCAYVSATHIKQFCIYMYAMHHKDAKCFFRATLHFQMQKTLSSHCMNDGKQLRYYQSMLKESSYCASLTAWF